MLWLALLFFARRTLRTRLGLLFFYRPPTVAEKAWITAQHRRNNGWIGRPMRRPYRQLATLPVRQPKMLHVPGGPAQ